MNKKTLILGEVLIILIIVAYVYQGPLKQWQNNLNKPLNFLVDLKIDKINKIEFVKNNITTGLSKEDDKWKIIGTKNFYAESGLADNLLKKLEQVGKGKLELVSNNKEKKADFEVDNKGVNLKLYIDDNKIVEFVIGKLSSDFFSTYISMSDQPITYAVKEDLQSFFSKTDWRDLTIFSSDKSKISKLRFQYPDRQFTLEKNKTDWVGVLPKKFSIKQDKIDKVLDIMSNLKSVSIPEQSYDNTGLNKNLIIIEVNGDEINNTIMVGLANKEGFYYAKKSDSDNIYLITKEQRDELNKTIGQLK